MFGFRFQTFKFQGTYEYVYIHCDTFVCQMDEKSEQCDRSCEKTRRRKREIDTDSTDFVQTVGRKKRNVHLHEIYHVDKGPLVISKTSEGETGEMKVIYSTKLHSTDSYLWNRQWHVRFLSHSGSVLWWMYMLLLSLFRQLLIIICETKVNLIPFP